MQQMAVTDSLTGVYNRHFFNETFRREIARALRYGKPLSVLLIDVDSFKIFNDTLGHLHGDSVLRFISEILTSQLRRSDILARFGGDEFIIVLPETDASGAWMVADKVQQSFNLKVYRDIPVSVSIGIATYRNNQTPEQMLEEADQELYRKKARNTSASNPLLQSEKPSSNLSTFTYRS
jgi:diguanylate cyclase (GGDEF)-like protein